MKMKAALILCAAFVFFYTAEASAAIKKDNTMKGKVTNAGDQNTFETPDFRFPETVIANAERVLNSSPSDEDLIKAVMQIASASNYISTDSVFSTLREIDRLAGRCSGPVSSILYSYEAQIVADIHSHNYESNFRNLPLTTPFPDNLNEWSGDMFRLKVLELCRKSLSDTDALKTSPISDWKEILVDFKEEQEQLCPDLYAFLCMRAIDLTKQQSGGTGLPIPFFGGNDENLNPSQKNLAYSNELLAQLTDYADQINSPLLLGELIPKRQWMSFEQCYTQLCNAYEKYKELPESFRLLEDMTGVLLDVTHRDRNTKESFDVCSERSKLIGLLEYYLEKFPNSSRINNIKNCVTELNSYFVQMSGQNVYRSDTSVKLGVNGLPADKKMYFKLFRFDKESNKLSNMKRIMDPSYSSFIEVREMKGSGDSCISDTIELDFGKLGYGSYGVVLAYDGGGNRKNIVDSYGVFCFKVSDMGSFVFSDRVKGDKMGLYVVDNLNGAPLNKVNVEIESRTSSNNVKTIKEIMVTNENGYVSVPKAKIQYGGQYTARKGADKITDFIYSPYIYKRTSEKKVTLYTDLALFHPGDTVEFVAVAYSTGPDGSHILANENINISFHNPSRNKVGTLNLTTDEYGKAAGSFPIPSEGMNGSYWINVTDEKGNNTFGSVGIEVADYVVPSFFVDIATSSSVYRPGDVVKVTGKVQTYSGMALAGASVKLNVRYNNYRPWYFMGELADEYSADLVSDASGEFSIDLPTKSLGPDYRSGIFTIQASATSPAGETQRSEETYFSLGASSLIELKSSGRIAVTGDTISLGAEVRGVDGSPVESLLEYSLINSESGKIVAEGTFKAPLLELQSDDIESGTYQWSVRIPDSDSKKSTSLVIFRLTDTTPPERATIWIPEKNLVASQGSSTTDVIVGSSFPNQYILCTLSDKNGVISSHWENVDSRNVRMKFPTPPSGETYFVTFGAFRDCAYAEETVRIRSYKADEKLLSEIVTFRDKITSGGNESWRIKYSLGKSGVGIIPVAATMTDKALNSIQPFSWPKFSLFVPSNNIYVYSNGASPDHTSWSVAGKMLKENKSFGFPQLNTYDITVEYNVEYYGSALVGAVPTSDGAGRLNNIRIRGASMKMADMKAEEESASAEDYEEVAAGGFSAESVNLRPSECPLAFFRPKLFTDADGILDLNFVAPDYNTTWQLKLMAYEPENLKNDVSTYEAVASKKVMVQSQLPRFLRTGDKAVFAFTAFNNSGEEAEINVKASIYNPVTGETIAERTFEPRSTAADTSFVETLEFVAPGNLSLIGVRVFAILDSSSDGEQSLIGILPSSTPVTESTPFYMAPEEKSYTLNSHSAGKDSTSVFSYCDNPVWYCVTALPDMTFPEDATIFSTLRHFYGNSIAVGLTDRYPRIREAVTLCTESDDSTLVSPLQRDNDLKLIALEETPWTLNAEGETMRLSRLNQLLDSSKCEENIKKALDEITNKQNADGGWSWCEGIRSSTFITGRVLLYFSMLRQMNFLPEDKKLDEMINRAVKYCDDRLYDDYIRSKKNLSTTLMMNYLYVRSGLGNIPMNNEFASLQKETIAAVKKGWGRFGIYHEAVAAIVMNRYGYPMEARSILESLNQKALKSPERGMWYDNLKSSWDGYNKLISTAQVLEAYNEISPDAPQIDRLRQWLLIQRQTEDWGATLETAEVVYAILSSGSDWMVDSDPARILINGKEQTISKRDALTGSFVIPLDSDDVTVEVIKSSGHQAWGGILSRMIVPIADVKPFSESDISISKRVLRVAEDANGTHTEEVCEGMTLKKGDKVRIELKLISKRDMDYVCVIDGRSACLSPVEQLSGYTCQEGIGYYRDVRNDCTNLYFDFLPKGVTYTGYDCYVSQDGVFSLGIAQTQCLYTPLQTAHSGGAVLAVDSK